MIRIRNKTLNICLTAILTALNVVMCIVTNNLYATQFVSFVYFFSFLAGVFLGTWSAACVGLMGYVISFMVATYDLFNPFLLLSNALIGVIVALCQHLPIKSVTKKVFIAFVITSLVCTTFLNTFGQWWMASGEWSTFLGYFVRVPWMIAVNAFNVALVIICVKKNVLQKMIKHSAGLFEQNSTSLNQDDVD